MASQALQEDSRTSINGEYCPFLQGPAQHHLQTKIVYSLLPANFHSGNSSKSTNKFAHKPLAVVSLLFGAVFAAPAPAPVPTAELTDANGKPVILKRGEGIYFVNCPRSNYGTGTASGQISAVVYCANDSDCNNFSVRHSSSDVCVSSTPGIFHIWEGSAQSCTFSSGVTFTWYIPSNAQTLPNYSYIGTASNGYRTFAGYKDDKHLGVYYMSHNCQNIYYYI